jgi:two-component system OmpR family sensor kinase
MASRVSSAPVLAGCLGSVFIWAFDEAIEMQDSALIQIGSLMQDGC